MDEIETTGSSVRRRLLDLGPMETYGTQDWRDYVGTIGLRADDVPELIALACAPDAPEMDPDSAEAWVAVHAWRALGQLRAADAVAPLVAARMGEFEDEQSAFDLPVVFGMIGAPAIAPLRDYLRAHPGVDDGEATALSGLVAIGRRHDECRAEVVAALTRVLHPLVGADPTRVGFAVAGLLDLDAVEAIGPIRDAFARDAVELSICGDLEDVEIDLKLRQNRDTPRPNYHAGVGGYDDDEGAEVPFVPEGPKIGRNDPCPCGSGKKYKKCCLV